METKQIQTSRPYGETRLVTASQWAVTAALFFPTAGSGLILLVSAVTSWTPAELLLWSPQLLQLLFVFAVLIGFVSGAYWPVFNGQTKAREVALYTPRRKSAKMLSGGLALYWVISLWEVITVTDLLQNMFVAGSAILICIYMYAYDVGGEGGWLSE
ncbi:MULTISPECIES: hypothetical protein [unclassified Haloferax]|uniref:hypothetical protein n=1 Tax=unclassified Haloferax TaxID=2625095 RepID=UPI0028748E81|nr:MULTISPECIES: hypothetical protein [unclassified Haloferax]MDS0243738.1 hypothetical protein [Haloferax sp. S2CR25]MDS0446859.1 hypothetical protein [Haloferax sp. S2CR25-2]